MAKKIIGLTGSLSSGKTLTAGFLKEKGAVIIDADDISHSILEQNPEVEKRIVECFGEEILNEGIIDRKQLARRVFGEKESLEKLCRILHPEIIKHIKEKVKLVPDDKIVVIDAPLLIESGLNEFVDIVIVVISEKQQMVERSLKKGVSEDMARQILKMQMSQEEKIKFSDYIIENKKDIQTIKEGVDRIWQKM